MAIESADADVRLPFSLKITSQKDFGGLWAGLFTLTAYNLATPVDLTGRRKIAGTGVISLDRTVGPIGGMEQKVAAERTAAVYSLAPAENHAAGRAVARRVQVVKVGTVKEAVAFLKTLPPPRFCVDLPFAA